MSDWVCEECKENHYPTIECRKEPPKSLRSSRGDWLVFKRGELRGKRLPREYVGRMKEAYAAGWSMGHLRNQQEFAYAGLVAVLSKFEKADLDFKCTNKHDFDDQLSQFRRGQKSVLDWLERWSKQ